MKFRPPSEIASVYELRGAVRLADGSGVEWTETVKGYSPDDPAVELVSLEVCGREAS